MDVSSASCLTIEIEIAASSHWLSRREARFACSCVPCQAGISVRPGLPYTGQAYNRECGSLISASGLIKPAGILTLCLRTKWHNRDKIDYESQKMAVRYLQMPIFLNGKRLDINQCRSPHYKFGDTRRDSAKTYRSPAHRSATGLVKKI